MRLCLFKKKGTKDKTDKSNKAEMILQVYKIKFILNFYKPQIKHFEKITSIEY